jgi:hypothetical protein
MNKTISSSTERLIADASELRDKEKLNDASRRFPSYSRVLGNFFVPLMTESHWGAARVFAPCCGRFPTVQAHVAFL